MKTLGKIILALGMGAGGAATWDLLTHGASTRDVVTAILGTLAAGVLLGGRLAIWSARGRIRSRVQELRERVGADR